MVVDWDTDYGLAFRPMCIPGTGMELRKGARRRAPWYEPVRRWVTERCLQGSLKREVRSSNSHP